MNFSHKLWLVISIIVCVGLFFVPTARNAVIRGAFFIIRPLLLYGSNVGSSINSFSDYFSLHRILVTDNKELREENLRLKERLVDYEIIKQENSILKKTTPFIEGRPYGIIGSRVIGSFLDATGPALIINGGKNQGISGGAFALTGDRVLIGRIATLYPNLATVASLRNTGMTLGIFIVPQTESLVATSAPRKQVDGLLIGKGNDLIIDLVPNEADVRLGDLVVTNGFGEGGIRNLLVGEIVSAKMREAAAFQEIHVSEAIPFTRISSVLVVAQPN